MEEYLSWKLCFDQMHQGGVSLQKFDLVFDLNGVRKKKKKKLIVSSTWLFAHCQVAAMSSGKSK